MVARYGLTVATHIITSSFGDLVGKVCDCLLRKGALTFHELGRSTQLSHKDLKNCLLVLIQHNCVQGFKPGGEDDIAGQRVATKYVAIFGNILHRLMFAKFITIINKQLGSQCESLLEALLEHGRLTLEQLILWGKGNICEGDHDIEKIVKEIFSKLVQARFVERCPAPDPSVCSDPDPTPKKKVARGAKVVENVMADEQLAVVSATCSEAQRFFLPTNMAVPDPAGKDQTDDTKTREKRKRPAMIMDSDMLASVCEKEVLWRANYEEFVRYLRHKACVRNVRTRLDINSAIVLEAILEATGTLEGDLKAEKTAPLLRGAILKAVSGSPQGRSMTWEHIRSALEELNSPCSGGADETHVINLKEIIEAAKINEVEAIVLERYGKDSYRIFRMLSEKGCPCGTKEVSDSTLVETKVAQKLLHRLWEDQYIDMVHVTGQPNALEICLWKVNKGSLWEHVLDDMYHAALNLSQRLAYEIEQEREIIMLGKQEMAGPKHKEKANRLKRIIVILEASLLKLNDSLMLFYNF